VEWIEEWKTAKNWKKQICGRAWWFKCPFFFDKPIILMGTQVLLKKYTFFII
jgi:hypothetical protein